MLRYRLLWCTMGSGRGWKGGATLPAGLTGPEGSGLGGVAVEEEEEGGEGVAVVSVPGSTVHQVVSI